MPPQSRSTARYVALLRGINVGGKNMLPMKELAAAFAAEGCTDVQTYIQSGNVLFRATPAVAKRVPADLEKVIASRFGLTVPVVVRSASELARAAAGNPFLEEAGGDVTPLHVVFLAHEPTAARIAALDPGRSPPDRFEARGREVYLHCPNGIGRSKLTNAYFNRKLGTTSTMRNWKTLLKLIELTSA